MAQYGAELAAKGCPTLCREGQMEGVFSIIAMPAIEVVVDLGTKLFADMAHLMQAA